MIIYYFSGTGNSLFVAKEIAKEFDAKLMPIAQGNKHEADIVGFVFPLYYLNMPLIVADFIEAFDFSEVEYTFAVCCRGAPTGGGAIKQLNNHLKKRDIILNGGFYISMADNYLPMFKMPTNEKALEINQKALEQLKPIIEKIKNKENEVQKGPMDFIQGLNYHLANKRIHNDKKFWVNDKCDGCRICKKVCPVNNIEISKKETNNKPQWQQKCERCFACIHFCPQQAIQYGRLTKNKTRFHNPGINIKEIIEQKNK